MSEIVNNTLTGHDKGTFDTIYQVHKKYPGGGTTGDYVWIQGYKHFWNPDRQTWVVTEERNDYWDHQLGSLSQEIGKVAGIELLINKVIDSGYLYGGVIGPLSPAPTMTMVKVFFLGYTAGVYHNFGDIEVVEGTTGIIKWDGTRWLCEELSFAKASDLAALKTKVDELIEGLKNVVKCNDEDLGDTEYEDF